MKILNYIVGKDQIDQKHYVIVEASILGLVVPIQRFPVEFHREYFDDDSFTLRVLCFRNPILPEVYIKLKESIMDILRKQQIYVEEFYKDREVDMKQA